MSCPNCSCPQCFRENPSMSCQKCGSNMRHRYQVTEPGTSLTVEEMPDGRRKTGMRPDMTFVLWDCGCSHQYLERRPHLRRNPIVTLDLSPYAREIESGEMSILDAQIEAALAQGDRQAVLELMARIRHQHGGDPLDDLQDMARGRGLPGLASGLREVQAEIDRASQPYDLRSTYY